MNKIITIVNLILDTKLGTERTEAATALQKVRNRMNMTIITQVLVAGSQVLIKKHPNLGIEKQSTSTRC